MVIVSPSVYVNLFFSVGVLTVLCLYCWIGFTVAFGLAEVITGLIMVLYPRTFFKSVWLEVYLTKMVKEFLHVR